MVVLSKDTTSCFAEMNPIKMTRFCDKIMVYVSEKFMATFRAVGDEELNGLREHSCGALALESSFRAL
jgi:hypothetical protein